VDANIAKLVCRDDVRPLARNSQDGGLPIGESTLRVKFLPPVNVIHLISPLKKVNVKNLR